MVGRRGSKRVSELLEIADEDKGFALAVDMRAEYELIELDERREERRLLRLAQVMVAGAGGQAANTPGASSADEEGEEIWLNGEYIGRG
jgi:hypothetical protein